MSNHIDEGTIHAWLDGAVDAPRAREIEAHVAECATCAAAVAEARGFIAGASRILMALDDVPAGVTPVRAPFKAPRRLWRAAPWVTAIAAALVLAVGVSTWNRQAVRTEMRAQVSDVSAPISPGLAPEAQSPQVDSAASAHNAAPVVPSTARASGTRAIAARREDAPRVRLGKASVREQKLENAAGAAADAAAPPVVAAAPRMAPAVPAAPEPSRESRAESRETQRRLARPEQLRLDAVVVTSTSAFSATRAAGCYRVQPPSFLGEAKARAASAAGAVAGAASRRGAAPSAAPAPTRAAEFSPSPVPPLLRLDTLTHPLGRVVRSPTSDSTIGWWIPVDGDSVQVDLLASGLFKLAAKDRVGCPER